MAQLDETQIGSIRNLLSEDGSIWISIDDDEQALFKILVMKSLVARILFLQNWQSIFQE